jgi:hypothetical protein
MIKVEREFLGTEKVEEVLLSFIEYMIDKLTNASYDKDRTNVTPNNKGVAK